MTEELKKKAKNYANKWLWFVKDLEMEHKTDPKPEYIRIEEAYIAGATENSIQWHDLRKDPNDLPEANWKNWVLAVYDNGILWCRARREVFTDGVYWVNSLHNVIHDVIMWARIEIPQFKE